jgi:murein DD-endopeptidase MepM/ murein hydrolase activator NlpD
MLVSINGVPIGTITAPFGSIDSWHTQPHTGIDIYFPEGYKLYAPLNGVVSKVTENHSLLGKAVFVRMDDGKQYLLGHLSEIKVQVGQKVVSGETLVGMCGSTGRSSGSHLHFGAIDQQGHFIDPYTLFERSQSVIYDQPAETVISMKTMAVDAFQWLTENIYHII